MSDNLKLNIADNDPNIKQAMASDPMQSVWVGASAGTGKTKVLTDRVLRLMLPRNGQGAESATLPHKILCLTFTKTAAAEMSARIYQRLSEWSVFSDDKLKDNLRALIGEVPSAEVMAEARKLFAKVLDTPGGLKIMTIHSFCQSVLKRFPVEAGLSPHFELVDEQEAIEYLSKCLHDIINETKLDKQGDIAKSFDALTLHLNAEDMSELMQQIMSKRSKLGAIIKHHGDNLITDIYAELGVDISENADDIIRPLKNEYIKKAVEPLFNGLKTDAERGQKIANWLKCKNSFDDYKLAFITEKGEIRKTLATKKVIEANPDIESILLHEAENIISANKRLMALKQAELNKALCIIASSMLGRYEEYKKNHNKLDYDDLIIKTSDLLASENIVPWVLYKLDTGIDHILVDEAQDTSRAQWKIIRALSEEFFEKFGSRDNVVRTLFVVGDDKQSIFSFQGADAEEFNRMYKFLEGKINPVMMNYSFRSTSAVLGTVDEVFKTEHLVYRAGQSGLVELWPLLEAEEDEATTPWLLPKEVITGNSLKQQMADKIASTIKGWLANKEILKSKNRPIKAGDIMVLVQSRGEFVELLMRALKSSNVPVAGFDRLKLMDEIAVTDLLALAKFALLPKDDLNLAALLKSPLLGLSEEGLYKLCYNRRDALWLNLRKQNKKAEEYLYQWIEKACRLTPYEFFAEVLHSPCAADTISGKKAFHARLGYDIEDAFDEFLNLCLHYEQSHVPNLQGFISWFEKSTSEIKREQEGGAQDVVRIMTIHASKGLQAPIVFLPDCSRKGHDHNRAKIRMVWPEDKEGVPLWASRKDFESEIYSAKQKLEAEKQENEYKRLLYVAMTRAEDRLYIGGWKGKKGIKDDCWYNLIANSFPVDATDIEGALRYEKEQEKEIVSAKEKAIEHLAEEPLPNWVFEKAAAEPAPPKPLSPSKLEDENEPSPSSPLAQEDEWKFSRGNIVHKLLELLPEIEITKREPAIDRYLEIKAKDISTKAKANLKAEILAVINNKDFAEIFSVNSKAEVPISGVLGEKVIAGTIDRLVVTEGEVLIVDYKSNRNPPLTAEETPEVYLKQLGAYASIIRKIYPEKEVKAALLWTEKTALIPISNNILDGYAI